MSDLKINNRGFVLIIGVAGMLIAASGWSAAHAQDALGSGDVLDANLSTSGMRNVASPDESLAYRVRNLLVTGNVAGGRGFRDSVGYTAAEDFRGVLGSDDLFQFRAESAFSAPSFILYRDQLTDLQIGQDLGTLEFRRYTTGSTLDDVVRPIDNVDTELRHVQLRLDRLITDSSISEQIERSSESRPIGVGRDEEGNVMVPTTTSVLGIETVPLEYAQQTAGMTVLDRAMLYDDAQSAARQQMATGTTPKPGSRYSTTFAELLALDTQVTDQAMDTRIDTSEASYEDVLRTVAERYSDGEAFDEQTADELDDDFLNLRRYLHGLGVDTAADDQTATDDAAQQPDESELLPNFLPGSDDETDATDEQPATGPDVVPLPPVGNEVFPTLESLGIALRHDQQLKSYSGGGDDRFSDLVRDAEQAIATGEYFWAERRFTRALRFSQNHPLALAGQAHAQIGAGLYVPAGLTLRQVLSRYPELIDVRYSREIMPARVRLVQNIEDIKERIDQGVEPGLMGFVQAYIGHQIDDRAMIESGLDAMAEASPDDRLLPLLRTIWLDAAGDDTEE